MNTLNRREVVKQLGLVAGVGAISGGPHLRLPTDEPSVSQVLVRLRLSGASERSFLEKLGRPPTLPTPFPVGRASRVFRPVEAQVVSKRLANGAPFAYGLSFTCSVRHVNELRVAGNPLIARRFCYSVSTVSWSAFAGGPVYESCCPRHDYCQHASYRDAKWHQIVPMILGQGYFSGCQATDVCESSSAGPVCFDVNDSDYEDNEGQYTVTVWSYS